MFYNFSSVLSNCIHLSNIGFLKPSSNFCFCIFVTQLFYLIIFIYSGSDNEENEAGEEFKKGPEEGVRWLLQELQLPWEVPGPEGDR